MSKDMGQLTRSEIIELFSLHTVLEAVTLSIEAIPDICKNYENLVYEMDCPINEHIIMRRNRASLMGLLGVLKFIAESPDIHEDILSTYKVDSMGFSILERGPEAIHKMCKHYNKIFSKIKSDVTEEEKTKVKSHILYLRMLSVSIDYLCSSNSHYNDNTRLASENDLDEKARLIFLNNN